MIFLTQTKYSMRQGYSHACTFRQTRVSVYFPQVLITLGPIPTPYPVEPKEACGFAEAKAHLRAYKRPFVT